MATSNLTIRIDDDLKKQVSDIAERYGLDLSTMTRALYSQIVDTNRIPLYFSPGERSPRPMIAGYEGDAYASGIVEVGNFTICDHLPTNDVSDLIPVEEQVGELFYNLVALADGRLYISRQIGDYRLIALRRKIDAAGLNDHYEECSIIDFIDEADLARILIDLDGNVHGGLLNYNGITLNTEEQTIETVTEMGDLLIVKAPEKPCKYINEALEVVYEMIDIPPYSADEQADTDGQAEPTA